VVIRAPRYLGFWGFLGGGGAPIPIFVVGSVKLDSVLQTEGSILEPCYEIWE